MRSTINHEAQRQCELLNTFQQAIEPARQFIQFITRATHRQATCKITFGNFLSGFSNGMHLAQYAAIHPDRDYRANQHHQHQRQRTHALHHGRQTGALHHIGTDQQAVTIGQGHQRSADGMLFRTLFGCDLHIKFEPFIALGCQCGPIVQIAGQSVQLGIHQQVHGTGAIQTFTALTDDRDQTPQSQRRVLFGQSL